MSIASDFAAAVAAAESDIAAAKVTRPAPFVGPNGKAEVTDSGGLKLTPTTVGNFEISGAAALAFRNWLTSVFG